jgi:dihydroorotase-like cyclic amidohydrolase
VEKVLELAVRHNYPIHIVHVSSPQSAKLIKQAKAHAPITCETAPHYLLLSDACLSKADGHRWLCTPPLRNENSRGELVEHLQDGVFDAIATDHCPFTIEDKDRFASIPQQVPNGLASLGATLPVLYEGLVKTGKLSMESLVNLICVNPWQLLGLPDADIILQTGYQGKIILTKDTGSALPVPSYSSSPNIWTGWTTGLEVICV